MLKIYELSRSLAFFLVKIANYIKSRFVPYIYTGQYTTNRNYGDALGYWMPILLGIPQGRLLPKRKVFQCQYRQGINLQMVGSTLGDMDSRSVVCGAGAIEQHQHFPEKPLKVLSVRGPLTRNILLQQGIECPPVYGDPAMLLPLFYQPVKRKPKYRLGVIPHYVDKETEGVKHLLQSPSTHLIDILLPSNGLTQMSIARYWKEWIDELCSCAVIVSSSLHGLILAEAYGIPTVWAEFSHEVNGNGFKFRDYYASIGITPPHPLNFVNTYPTQEQVIAAATKKDTSLVNPQHYAAYLRQELTDSLYIMR